jgi:light-regulated signal transduction histidine kinase (bacteriophytochrome)
MAIRTTSRKFDEVRPPKARGRRASSAERQRAERILARQARDLERTRRELEQFAYVVSHDLQEPLRMVSSYLQLLERRYKDKLDSDAEDFINFAVDGAQRMHNLIADLVNYSRVNTRANTFEPIDFNRALDRALAAASECVRSSTAVITRDPLPTLIADGVQVEQLFRHLIDNAVKFQNGRRPRVHIGAELRAGEWVFFVRDNGIGIDPELADRIFLVFQRLHGRGEYPGTGMGLAICQRIVERRGGRIWVESEPGKGSTFYFTMPQRTEARA